MNDPFAPVQPYYDPNTSPSPGVGVDVLDAPDHTLKMATIKASLGQPLTSKELSRLATRQSVEAETARQNMQAGNPFINAGRSVAGLVTGTGLDSTLQNARVRGAVLSTNPVLAQLEQDRAEAAHYGMAGFNPADPAHQDELANERVNQHVSASTGTPIELVRQQNQVVNIPRAPLAPVEAPAAPVAAPDYAAPSTPAKRAKDAAEASYGQTLSTPEAETDAEFQRVAGGRPMTLLQAGSLRATLAEKHAPTASKIEVADPLSGDIHEIPALVDKATGKPYSFTGPATFKTAGPNKTIDTEFQKDYNDWVVNGDSGKAKLSVSNLQGAANSLVNGDVSAASGPMLSLIPEVIRKRIFPTATNTQNTIEVETLKGLRALFGARVAVSEMQNTLARTFDPALPQALNAQRAVKLADTIRAAAEAKDAATKYFQDHGTLGGYRGPKVLTIDEVVETARSATASATPATDKAAAAYRASLGL